MKASLTITAMILAVACFLGWRNQGKLEEARQARLGLEAEAQALGLEARELLKNGSSPQRMKNQREAAGDKEAHAKDYARRLAAFANEMKQAQSEGEENPGMQRRVMAIVDEMLQLDVAQLKIVIAELRTLPDVDPDMRRGIIGFAIMTMAEDQPKAALTLFTESSDLLGKEGPGGHVVSSALAKWAQDDPMGAMEWIKANAKDHPNLVNEEAKGGLLSGAAKQDPRLAFQLIDELGLTNRHEAGAKIASSAKTPAERTAILAALRDHVKNAKDPDAAGETERATLRTFAQQLANDGFTASTPWLESAALTKQELEGVSDGLSWWNTKDDTGKWIDWMSDKMPTVEFKRKVDDLVSNWTRQDYKAAGEWINASKEGPARDASVRIFSVTVAPFEPESGAQWAETLPPGKERDEALRSIHSEWTKKDKAAATDFAKKHGLGN